MLPRLACAIAGALLQPPATAQEPLARADWSHFQQPDGRFADPAAEDDQDAHDRAVATTAWAILAMTADGSTLRTGPHRQLLRQAVQWLRNQQDEEGCFVPARDPDFISRQALANLAIAESSVLGHYATLHGPVRSGTRALLVGLQQQNRVGLPADELLPARLLSRCVQQLPEPLRTDLEPQLLAALARTSSAPPDSPRRLAAELALHRLQGKELAPARVAAIWPADLSRDPLHDLYAAILHQQQGDAAWLQSPLRLAALAHDARAQQEREKGTAIAPAANANGSLGHAGTFAVESLVRSLWYRHCRLVCLANDRARR